MLVTRRVSISIDVVFLSILITKASISKVILKFPRTESKIFNQPPVGVESACVTRTAPFSANWAECTDGVQMITLPKTSLARIVFFF